MSQPAKLLSTAPILMSRELEKTDAFYTQKMGFKTLSRYPDYLIIAREGVELHFSLVPDLNPDANNCQVYVRLSQIEALYEEYRSHGIIHPNGSLSTKPWGMKEFAVLDLDSNLLKFGEATG